MLLLLSLEVLHLLELLSLVGHRSLEALHHLVQHHRSLEVHRLELQSLVGHQVHLVALQQLQVQPLCRLVDLPHHRMRQQRRAPLCRLPSPPEAVAEAPPAVVLLVAVLLVVVLLVVVLPVAVLLVVVLPVVVLLVVVLLAAVPAAGVVEAWVAYSRTSKALARRSSSPQSRRSRRRQPVARLPMPMPWLLPCTTRPLSWPDPAQ